MDAFLCATDTYDYDAFGNVLASSGSTESFYLYTGEQFDADLGIYFLRARYHDQRKGRFVGMDSFEGLSDVLVESLHGTLSI